MRKNKNSYMAFKYYLLFVYSSFLQTLRDLDDFFKSGTADYSKDELDEKLNVAIDEGRMLTNLIIGGCAEIDDLKRYMEINVEYKKYLNDNYGENLQIKVLNNDLEFKKLSGMLKTEINKLKKDLDIKEE